MSDGSDEDDVDPFEFLEEFSEDQIGQAVEYVSLLFDRDFGPSAADSLTAIRIVVRQLRKVADELEQQVVDIESDVLDTEDTQTFFEEDEDGEDNN